MERLKMVSVLVMTILVLFFPLKSEASGPEWKGTISQRPGGLTGSWTIGGRTFQANGATRFEQEHGPLSIGVCAEVEYYNSGGVDVAVKIETTEAYECGTTPPPSSTYRQGYGVLESFPADFIGSWQISGVNYTVNNYTHLEQDDSPFFVGGCVEIKYQADSMTAIEIETEDDAYKCNSSSGPVERKFYGLLAAPVPAAPSYIGTWTVGNKTFTTSTTPAIEQEHGPLAAGTCVEIEYYENGSTLLLTKIETERLYKCSSNTFKNKVYGRVTNFPANLYGSWMIDNDSDYNAGPNTYFEGPFAINSCVEIEYYVQNGIHQAVKIEREDDNHCGGGTPPSLPMNDSKVFATIDSFPAGPSYIGSWVIGGVTYQANNATRFEQEDGPFANGTCVKAHYVAPNSLTKVETEKAIRCQGNTAVESSSYGVVESYPTGLIGSWQVSGITFQTTATTKFEQEHGFFSIGAYVEVKYTALNQVISIETHVASGSGLHAVSGKLDVYPEDEWGDWVINGVTYHADPVTEVDDELDSGQVKASEAPVIGQPVILNAYQNSEGQIIVTSAAKSYPIYMPLISK